MLDFFKTILTVLSGIGLMTCFYILHDYIFRHIYCCLKTKRNNRKKCYFWTCPKFNSCSFNDNEEVK